MKYLYHASPNKDIDILEPRAESIRDPKEGPVVFASDDKSHVTCFLVPTDDSWTKISIYRSNRHPDIHVIYISDEKRFKQLDKGGAIYYLSPKSFYLDKSKNNTEWTSKDSVVPIKKDIYNNSLDAMIEHGVYVYFCDEYTLKTLKECTRDFEKTMSILKTLKSENEKRGKECVIHKYY